MRKDCGLDLFHDFTFEDITTAEPPDAEGVYVLLVRKPGMPPDEIMESLKSHPEPVTGDKVPKSLLKLAGRIRKIGDCPILFIGSAAGYKTLSGVHRDIGRHHATHFPVRALLSFGWELDFGWKATDHPREVEAELKERYLNRGRRALPALAVR